MPRTPQQTYGGREGCWFRRTVDEPSGDVNSGPADRPRYPTRTGAAGEQRAVGSSGARSQEIAVCSRRGRPSLGCSLMDAMILRGHPNQTPSASEPLPAVRSAVNTADRCPVIDKVKSCGPVGWPSWPSNCRRSTIMPKCLAINHHAETRAACVDPSPVSVASRCRPRTTSSWVI